MPETLRDGGLGRAGDARPTRAADVNELDTIDWRRPFRRLRHAVAQHWALVLISGVVSVALMLVYMRAFPPIYSSGVMVRAEADQDVVRSAYYANWNVFRKGDVESELELVTSGRVVQGVVSELGLRFDDVHHGLLTHAAYLWTESWLGQRYRDFKQWLFPPDPSAYQPTPQEIDAARTVDAFKKSISINIVPGTLFASIDVKAPTFRAAEFANKLADAFLAERNRLFRSEADAAYQALQVEVARAAAELEAVDRRRLEFDTRNQIVLDFEKDKLVVANWATLSASIHDIQSSIDSLEASRQVIEQQLAREPEEVVSSKRLADSSVKGLLQAREFELDATLQQVRERYRPGSPEVTQLEKLLAETRATLKRDPGAVEIGQDRTLNPAHTDLRQRLNLVVAQLASARASLASKKAPLAELEQRIYKVPALVKEITELSRAREGLELRYKLLRERAMMAEVSRSTVDTTAPSVRIIDYARPPSKPDWPVNIIVLPGALLAGLIAGLGIALTLELVTGRVNRDRIATRRDMPVYAVIRLPNQPSGWLHRAP